jgi:DNA polymerase-1
MKLLIDTELYLFAAASACEFEAEWDTDDWTYLCRHGDVKASLQDSIAAIREVFPDGQPVLAFGDRASFRYGIWPSYKANRKSYRKPAGYLELGAWVETVAPTRGWEVARLPDVEGDDVLGILCEPGDVICSWDKDLLTIPGLHYRREEVVEVDQLAADRAFYMQVLTGDAADNYPGCPGYGPVTAERLLSGWTTDVDFWREVVNAYTLKSKAGTREAAEKLALQQARCARILRAGEYDMATNTPRLWNPPVA